jgi:hypothetical protein
MKMDLDEFKTRLREVTDDERPVAITEQDRVVGHYLPVSNRNPDAIDIDGWARARLLAQEKWVARTPDWIERLTRFGLDENGEPSQNEYRP